MDQNEGRPFAHIKVRDTMVVDLYGLKGNSLDEFNPWRERGGMRRTPHRRDAQDGDKENGGGGAPHSFK
jgi:hypothetical protein